MIISNLNIYKIKNHHECAEQTLVCLYERRKDFNIYIYIYYIEYYFSGGYFYSFEVLYFKLKKGIKFYALLFKTKLNCDWSK